jgi:hypothetical protein
MRRRLSTLATVLSLLLCVATVVAWVRSYSVPEKCSLEAGHRYLLQSCRGGITLSVQTCIVYTMEGIPDNYEPFAPDVLHHGHEKAFSEKWRWSYSRPLAERTGGYQFGKKGFWVYVPNRAGFGWGRQLEINSAYLESMLPTGGCVLGVLSARYAVLPYWFLSAVTALLPSLQVWRWAVGRWRNSRRPGACRQCGYDLTGNTSGVCPECGTNCTTHEDRIRKIPAEMQSEG